MKIISKIKSISYAGLLLLLAATTTVSCQSGLEYEEAPENYYTDVDVQASFIYSRYLFKDCVYGKNYNQYTSYIAQTSLPNSTVTWTNETGADYTLKDGTVIANGETATIPTALNTMTTRDDASAPDGKVYVITYYVPSKVTYKTANKGFLFDMNKYTGSDSFTLIDGSNGMAEQVEGDVDVKQLVISLVGNQYYGTDTTISPQNGAPALGVPGDFSEPRQYLMKNNMYRPSGVPQAQRLYEIQVVKLP